MRTKEEHRITGDLKLAKHVRQEEFQELVQALQTFMNTNEIVKIDVCLDPFNRGEVVVAPKDTILSTQN